MVELHLHLDGSLRVETVWDLAREQGIKLPADSPAKLTPFLRVPENCPSLTDYLTRFDLPLAVLQNERALERVAFELTEDLAAEGLDYAEMRFAPQLHTAQGMKQAEAARAVEQGIRRGMMAHPEIRCGLILCCMRGADNESANLETLETAKSLLGEIVCAADLAGAESLFPTKNFAGLFQKAREYGLPLTIHAGESEGAESVKQALAFGTKRIGHGVFSIQDPELVKRLVDEKITLEVAVISNLHTKAFADVRSHPIRRLFDAGVRVTINSDNRTVSNTNLQKEIDLLKREANFTDSEIDIMQRYAREAAFLS